MSAREAVAPLVHEGVLERRFGSGTYVTGRRAETFVAVVTELDIAHPAVSPSFLRIIQAIRRHLDTAGRRTRVYIGHASPFDEDRESPPRITSPEFWADLKSGQIEGVALVATEPEAALGVVEGRDIPVVDSTECGGKPCWDIQELVRLGLQALVARGCRTVACIDHEKVVGRNKTLAIVADALESAGLATRPEWMVPAQWTHARGEGPAAFRAIWRSHAEKPDGLFVLDDMLYRDLSPMLLLNSIHVPKDLVVVSQTDAEDAQPFVPEPVRVEIDNLAIGTAIARNLLNRMRNPNARPEGFPVPLRVVAPKGDPQATLKL